MKSNTIVFNRRQFLTAFGAAAVRLGGLTLPSCAFAADWAAKSSGLIENIAGSNAYPWPKEQ